MQKKLLRMLACVLSLALACSSIPFAAIAVETGTLTISSNVTANDIAIDDDVAFDYEIMVNDEPYTGTAVGDDGNTYSAKDGKITIPYSVSATLSGIPAGAFYTVKRLAYDNEKYALIDGSEVKSGYIAKATYYRNISVNDQESTPDEEITADVFNAETDNGAKLSFTVYHDEPGNAYNEDEVAYRGGYTDNNDASSGNYAHQAGSVESFKVTATVVYKDSGTSGSSFKKKAYANADYTFRCEGLADAAGNVNQSIPLVGANEARSAATIALGTKFNDYVKACRSAIAEKTGKSAYLDGKVSFSWEENTTVPAEITISAFTLTEKDITTYNYRISQSDGNPAESFDVTLAPAPTGTFQINFALNGTVPTGSENAVFEIKNAAGEVLTEGVDYTKTMSPYDVSEISKGVLDWGITIYTFSGIKAGLYTITQVSTDPGYKIDSNVYAFAVARRDGAIIGGEEFSTTAINTSVLSLNNADKSINVKLPIVGNISISLKFFMNDSFTLAFQTLDQNDEPVVGAEFMMVERAALFELIGQLAAVGKDVIGSTDLSSILDKFSGLDLSNLDAGAILDLLLVVLELAPSLEGQKLTLPALLMATSNDEGMVRFTNSSNILNVLEVIQNLGEVVEPDKIAETIQNLVGSAVPAEYMDVLVKLVKYIDILNVHTGIPSGAYALFETKAPDGYERSSVMYTIQVSNDGTATTTTGVLVPILAEVINDRFGVDLYEILVNEEEFNKVKDTIGNAFGTFDEYMNSVVDTIVDIVDNDLNGVVDTTVLKDFRDTVNNAYEEYPNFADAIGEGIKKLNASIRTDLTEDWVYHNDRYVVPVAVQAGDCQNTAFVVTAAVDANGDRFEVVDGVANVYYGVYTFEIEVPGGYALNEEDSSAAELIVNDHTADYSVNYLYYMPQVLAAVDPTCTETGLTEGSKCALCGKIYVAQEIIDALGHNFTGDYVDLGNGSHTRKCVNGDCTATGLMVDDAAMENETAACENFVYTIIDGDTAMHTATCADCGYTVAETHKTTIIATTDATCTEDGTITYTCDSCEMEFTLVNPDDLAFGHNFSGDYVTNGIAKHSRKCVNDGCDAIGLMIDGAAATDATEECSNWVITNKDETMHTYKCAYCDFGGEMEHEWAVVSVQDQTCTEDGVKNDECVYCDATKSEPIPANGHTTVVDAAVAPTCTETGLTEGSHCAVCGVVLVEQQVIPALGHDVVIDEEIDPTCISLGCTQGSHCARCGEILKMQTVIAYADHIDANGDHFCDNCGKRFIKCSMCSAPELNNTNGFFGRLYKLVHTIVHFATELKLLGWGAIN